ncbi:MAG: hypothetical protein MZV70_15550 [Desulfobacterales bacterium]|nr:hypothetical protein [Desulfobacterales bacterium]
MGAHMGTVSGQITGRALQDLVHGHGVLELGIGIHGAVEVVLRGNDRQLALGGPEGGHVPPEHVGIHIHEGAPGLFRPRRRRHRPGCPASPRP